MMPSAIENLEDNVYTIYSTMMKPDTEPRDEISTREFEPRDKISLQTLRFQVIKLRLKQIFGLIFILPLYSQSDAKLYIAS